MENVFKLFRGEGINLKSTAALVLLIAACLNSNNPSKTVSYVKDLRLSDSAVAGWKQGFKEYKIFDGQILMDDMIDGGAGPYIDEGLIEGIQQILHFDTLYECKLWIMDYGSPAKAQSMLNRIEIEFNGDMTLRIAGFDSTIARGSENVGGCVTVAQFDRFYLQLQMSGYTDVSPALRDAKTFLTVIKNKITIF